MSATLPYQAPTSIAPIRVEASILQRAKANDVQAITTMFQQFVSPDEEIYFAEYCGVQGLWGLGRHCFACLTNRRVASLTVGLFGFIVYQDGFLEYGNSGVIYQPSKLWLYLFGGWAAFVALALALISFAAGIGVFYEMGGVLGLLAALLVVAFGLAASALVFLLTVKAYYRFFKCGLVWWIREGIAVYVFTNRSKLTRANHLYRLCTQLRDERLKAVGHP